MTRELKTNEETGEILSKTILQLNTNVRDQCLWLTGYRHIIITVERSLYYVIKFVQCIDRVNETWTFELPPQYCQIVHYLPV